MLVFRIERDGNGPYTTLPFFGSSPLKSALKTHQRSESHPGTRDIKLRDGEDISDFIFAFKSFEQYRRWFHRRFTVLHANGFKLFIYNVHDEDVRYGDYQIVFKSETKLPRKLIGVYSVVGPLPSEVKRLIKRDVSCENVGNVVKTLNAQMIRSARVVERTKNLLTKFVKMAEKINPEDFKLSEVLFKVKPKDDVINYYC